MQEVTGAMPMRDPGGYTDSFLDTGCALVHVTSVRAGAVDRPAVLFVHGHFGSSYTWLPLMRLLADTFDCTAVDLPGFGRSPPPASYALPATVDTLAATIKALGPPVHVVGNSYGGTLAALLAAGHPDLVRSLTLISPALVPPTCWTIRSLRQALARLCGGARALRRRMDGRDPAALSALLLRECCADVAALAPEVVELAEAQARDAKTKPWRAEAEARSFRMLALALTCGWRPGGVGLRSIAARIGCPTLILWGERDRALPMALARRTACRLPHATLRIVPATGHLPHLEAPSWVAAEINAYHASPATAPPTSHQRWPTLPPRHSPTSTPA